MEFLTQLFGNLTSGIIRLGVTVGILAAVYFFVLRPVLDTTNHAVDSANKSIEDANRQVQIQVKRSFHSAKLHGNPEKLLHCVQKANGNVQRIERCTRRF